MKLTKKLLAALMILYLSFSPLLLIAEAVETNPTETKIGDENQELAIDSSTQAENFLFANEESQLVYTIDTIEQKENEGAQYVVLQLTVSNNTPEIKRIPPFQIDLLTQEGIRFRLPISEGTTEQGIQPYATTTFQFAGEVTGELRLAGNYILIYKEDLNVYPREQKPYYQWKLPEDMGPSYRSLSAYAWGDVFRVEEISKFLAFKPVGFETQIVNGWPQQVIKIEVENQGLQPLPVPELGLNLYIDDILVPAQALPASKEQLLYKEKGYLYFSIASYRNFRIEPSLGLDYLVIYQANTASSLYNREMALIMIDNSLPTDPTLPKEADGSLTSTTGGYAFGTPIRLDETLELLPPETELSLLSLYKGEHDIEGMEGWVAKFELNNKAKGAISVPEYYTQLQTLDGTVFTSAANNSNSSNQSVTAQFGNVTIPGTITTTENNASLAPTQKEVLAYTFAIPVNYAPVDQMKLVTEIANGLVVEHAGFAITEGAAENVAVFYPYQLKIKGKNFVGETNDITEEVTLDYNFILEKEKVPFTRANRALEAEFELRDSQGTIIDTVVVPLSGEDEDENVLKDGSNTVTFTYVSGQEFIGPLYVYIYERIGEVRTLWKKM